MVNLCDAHRESVVVVNTGARNNKGVTAYGETLNSTLSDLGRKLTTLWVVNRQRDSLELLKDADTGAVAVFMTRPESPSHRVRREAVLPPIFAPRALTRRLRRCCRRAEDAHGRAARSWIKTALQRGSPHA